FWELMWNLQFYVNRKEKIFPEITTPEDYNKKLSMEEKVNVRGVLFDNIEQIDDFIRENPPEFSEEKLEIISKWKHFVSGDFYMERYLKKYAVFIGADKNVYAVLGIKDSFDEMIHKSYLPYFVNTILLPFKGRIIYDGVLMGRNIFFGRNIKADLKEDYMAAKQNGRIIENLDPDIRAEPVVVETVKNWKPELLDLYEKAKKLRGGAGQPAINSPAFSLIKAGLELALTASDDPADEDSLLKCLGKIERAAGNIENAIYRASRY
ncbi:MAG: hypothetical protein V2I97_13220, partial [Desulfococcaceae bacterium]|nr:hypothetical protein [Desulfococcaceae bacterium]